MQSIFLVTSPHARCKSSTTRMCDTVAAMVARCFCATVGKYLEELGQRSETRCVYVEGDEYRHDHDLNRKPSRHTPFRRSLTLSMKIQPHVLVDIHSFPNYWMPEAGDINFFKKHEQPPEMVILTGPRDRIHNTSLSAVIEKQLSRRGVNIKTITGIKINDILNEANEYNIPAVLLEFNEKLIDDPTRVKQLCHWLADIFLDILEI